MTILIWYHPQVIIIWAQAINIRFLTHSNEQKYERKKLRNVTKLKNDMDKMNLKKNKLELRNT